MRGGTANCAVIISDELIASPIVTNPDILIVMNDASLQKFQPQMKQKGILIFDSSLIKNPALRNDVDVLGVPATEISSAIGYTKSANMVLVGVLIAKTRLLEETMVFEAIENLITQGKKSIEMNRMAIMGGMRFFEDKKN